MLIIWDLKKIKLLAHESIYWIDMYMENHIKIALQTQP